MFRKSEIVRAASALGYSVRRTEAGDIRVARKGRASVTERQASYADTWQDAACEVRAFEAWRTRRA